MSTVEAAVKRAIRRRAQCSRAGCSCGATIDGKSPQVDAGWGTLCGADLTRARSAQVSAHTGSLSLPGRETAIYGRGATRKHKSFRPSTLAKSLRHFGNASGPKYFQRFLAEDRGTAEVARAQSLQPQKRINDRSALRLKFRSHQRRKWPLSQAQGPVASFPDNMARMRTHNSAKNPIERVNKFKRA